MPYPIYLITFAEALKNCSAVIPFLDELLTLLEKHNLPIYPFLILLGVALVLLIMGGLIVWAASLVASYLGYCVRTLVDRTGDPKDDKKRGFLSSLLPGAFIFRILRHFYNFFHSLFYTVIILMISCSAIYLIVIIFRSVRSAHQQGKPRRNPPPNPPAEQSPNGESVENNLERSNTHDQ